MTLNEKLLSTPKLFARENDIIKWGQMRNIIGDTAQGSFEGQQEKTRQEWQEYQRDRDRDGLGDVFVTLVMQCALEKTTVSECVNSEFPHGFEPFDEVAEGMGEDSWLDDSIEELLKEGNDCTTFSINIAFAVDALHHCAVKRGWTLDECVEVAWNDIKDRKGIMCHGTFVKQTNIDTLKGAGVEFNNELQAFTGTCFFMEDFLSARTTFDSLGFTFEQSGTITKGIKLKTTGSN